MNCTEKHCEIQVVKILNIWQVVLYKTNGLDEIETYVSKNKNGEYKIVYVFDREKSNELFAKFRSHELKIGEKFVNLKM